MYVYVVIILAILLCYSSTQTNHLIEPYETTPIPETKVIPITFKNEPIDPTLKMMVNNVDVVAHNFVYGKERNEGTAIYNTSYFTFVSETESPVTCILKCSGKWTPINPQIGSGGSIIPIEVIGSEIRFVLPAPNMYYYHANIKSSKQEPICHFAYDPKDILTPPPNARIIKGNVTMNQFIVENNETVFMEPGTVITCVGNNDVFLKMGNNSTLIGAGIIDTDNRTNNICNISSRNVLLRGVTLRKSKAFGYVVSGVNVVGEHLKIFTGVDGADPVACNGYTLRKSAVVAVDDAWAIKSHKGAVTKVLVEDCICQSRKSAFKLGTESINPYTDIQFKNCTLLNGCRFIALYLVDGGSVKGLSFTNLRGYLITWPGENRSGRWIDCDGTSVATIKREQKNSPIYDCLIKDCTCYGVSSSNITATGTPTNITCVNVTLYPVSNSVNLYNKNGNVTLNVS